jgi:transcriptional regulator with XRE-family HTH domain
MIVVMAQNPPQTLGEYIKERLGERSVRALAHYAGIGVATASKLINDKTSPDPDTLKKVAEYLDVPVENLYRLAGYLDENKPARNLVIDEVEYLMRDLPEESQKKILDQVRLERKYTLGSDDSQERKAS